MDRQHRRQPPGGTAPSAGQTLDSRRIGALPLINGFLARLGLEESLTKHLPREDRRSRVPTATALLLLVRNLLISRESLYGPGEWATRHDNR
jgi:hypothetical protein